MAFIQNISFGALEGPDDSTFEWQEDIGAKLQVEEAVKELVNRVVEESMSQAFPGILFRETEPEIVGDHEYDEGISDIELSDDESGDLWIDTRYGDVRRCEICSQTEWTIWERIRTGRGEPVDSLRENEGRLMCGCCEEMLDRPFSDYNHCSNCFVSEKMARRYGISMVSIGGSPEGHLCSICNDIHPNMAEQWPIEEGEWVQLLDGTWVFDGDVYEGEYENEDPQENNTEIVKGIKDTISEIGENIFDIQEKISEGEYLKVMDLLQKVINDVNGL